MTAEPADPVWYPVAIKQLWEKLAAHEGIDLSKHQLEGHEENTEEALAARRRLDERLEQLHSDAQIRILGLVLCGEIRAWIEEGDRWKRPTLHLLKQKLMRPSDEPVELHIDQVELDEIYEGRWAADLTSALSKRTADKTRRPRGRPIASGSYALDDRPLLNEMRRLLLAKEVRSVSAAANAVAHKAEGGGTPASKATRLRKGYVLVWGAGE